MFTASTFSLIRQNCPEKLNELLQLLDIEKPDWEHGDEFEIAQELDEEINKNICRLLNSDSDLAGYAKLLDMGGVRFSVSETRKERLAKIIDNRDQILNGKNSTAIEFKCMQVSSFDLNMPKPIKSPVKSVLNTLTGAELIVALEREYYLSFDAKQRIKNIIVEELGAIDEILLAVIPSKNVSASPIRDLDKVLEILERLNEIYNKI